MNKIKTQIISAKVKTDGLIYKAKTRFLDTRGDGYVDLAVKVIIGVVVGALVLAGLILLWNSVIMPRLGTEITGMFG